MLEGPHSDLFDAAGAGAFGAEWGVANAQEVGGVVGGGAVEVEPLAGEEAGAEEDVRGEERGRGRGREVAMVSMRW